jgi:hypothetical protein
VKITIEKVQLSTLETVFSILFSTYFLFYSLFSLNIILCARVCERKMREQVYEIRKGREKKKKRRREKLIKNYL